MSKNSAHDQFRDFLRKAKHRVTPERFEVLDFALDYIGHFGADDLYVLMKTQKSNVSRATIYNTLELLAACELLAKRNFGDGITRYESSYNRKNHDHLICTTCGNVTEFRNDKIQEIVEQICDDLGFQSERYSFNIFGKCEDSEKCKNTNRIQEGSN